MKPKPTGSYSPEPVQYLLLLLSSCASDPNEPALLSSVLPLFSPNLHTFHRNKKKQPKALTVFMSLYRWGSYGFHTWVFYFLHERAAHVNPHTDAQYTVRKTIKRYLRNKDVLSFLFFKGNWRKKYYFQNKVTAFFRVQVAFFMHSLAKRQIILRCSFQAYVIEKNNLQQPLEGTKGVCTSI